MKKGATLLLLVIFSLSIISAAGIEIELTDDDEFFQSEVLQAEIIGTFLENLKPENIAIYDGDKVHSTPTSSTGLLKLENKYLYYAALPSTEGNYSVKIQGIEYYVGQEILDDEIVKNFTIISTLDPYLAITPGFVSATRDFTLTIKSLNGVQEIEARFEETSQTISKEIGYNSEKSYKFFIQEISEYTESEITIGDYTIPVFVYPESTPPEPFIDPDATNEETTEDEEDVEPEVVALEDSTPQQQQTCEDINGQLCKKSQTCSGPTSFAEDVVCCLGTCEDRSKSGFGWVIGILIVLIVVVGSLIVLKKYGDSKKPKSAKEALEQRNKKFNQRMFPNLQDETEVRGSLTKE